MISYTFIVNPKAGRTRKNSEFVLELRHQLQSRGVSFELMFTEHAGHGFELARQANSEVVVAVGGDGTVNEVANGLFGTGKTLGILPTGSGNDFIKSIEIPRDFSSALDVLLRNQRKQLDCAIVVCENAGQAIGADDSTRRCFINGVGIGFDAAVAERTSHIQYLSGTALYLAAVFQMLGKYRSPDFTVELDSISTKSRNLLIAIGNGRCAGGGFYLTPNAKVDDGVLDICLVEESSVLEILKLMPRVMLGKHGRLKTVQMKTAERIALHAPQPFFVHADGEMVGKAVNHVEVQIKKSALKTIVGC